MLEEQLTWWYIVNLFIHYVLVIVTRGLWHGVVNLFLKVVVFWWRWWLWEKEFESSDISLMTENTQLGNKQLGPVLLWKG